MPDINFWQEYNCRIDPWDASYESPVQPQEELFSATAIDPHVEMSLWMPYRPTGVELPERAIFVDGRRRVDARFLGSDGDRLLYGAFATIAVGAVAIDRANAAATFLEPVVQRVLAIGSNTPIAPADVPCPLGTESLLTYDRCLTSESNDPKAPLNLVQKAMLEAEAQLAAKLEKENDALVVRDGPLLYGPFKAPDYTVGYVKTMGKAYLSGKYNELLTRLEIGERTPIFAIGDESNRRRRWSWYLRSGTADFSPQNLGYHGLQGIVRLELYGEVPLKTARAIADRTTFLIPEYASHPVKDPRAPQNLVPVGALERELGRWMGDGTLVSRRVRAFVASQVRDRATRN